MTELSVLGSWKSNIIANCVRCQWRWEELPQTLVDQFSISNIPTISEGTDSGCNLYSVTTGWMLLQLVVFFWGKTMRTMTQLFLCQTEESATLYKHCHLIWPFSFEDCWHINTNTIATPVKSLQWVIIVVHCRCSVSPNSMTICLFGDAVRFYFIVLRSTCKSHCSASQWSMTVPAKQTMPSAPYCLRT